MNTVVAVPEVFKLWKQAHGKFSIESVTSITEDLTGDNALGYTEMNPDGSYTVSLSQTLVKTNLQFVSVLGHELKHVLYNGNMTYEQWNNRSYSQKVTEEIDIWTNFNLKFMGIGEKEIKFNKSLIGQ